MDTSTIVQQGNELLASIKLRMQNSNIGANIKQILSSQAAQIQSLLNEVFIQTGIIDQSQIDYANTTLDNAKKAILEADAKVQKDKTVLFVLIGVSSLAILYILTK